MHEGEPHPFRLAWQTRDVDAWSAVLAPDVILHSPLLRSPFIGRDAARELYAVLFDVLQDIDISHELTEGAVSAFSWTATVGGQTIEGVDLVRRNDEGLVVEVRVLMRPLVSLAVFADAVGPVLASRRSSSRGRAARLASAPLPRVFRAIDVIATRLSQGPHRST